MKFTVEIPDGELNREPVHAAAWIANILDDYFGNFHETVKVTAIADPDPSVPPPQK